MPVSVFHALTATSPDDPAYEIRPSHYNSAHLATISAVGSEIFGAFSNDPSVNVSFSTNPSGFVIASANVTAAPSPVNVTGNGSSVNAQTIAFTNANGITLGVSTAANGATITGSHNAITTGALSNHSHGDPQLNLTNLSGTTASNSAGFTLSLSAATGLTSQSNQNITAANGGFAFQTLSFSNLNGISFGTSAGSAITASHNAITTGRASNDAVGLATAQTNVTWTVNSAGLSLNAGGYAGTGTSATNASITLNSNGLAISVGAGGGANFSAGASTGGNTAGDTGITGTRLVFVGSNNITMSQATDANGATLSVIGANTHAQQTGISSVIVSDATYTSGMISFSNQNGVTIGSSVNGATQFVRLSVANQSVQTQSLIAAVYDGANSISTGTVRFTNANGVTFTINGQTISGSVATTYRASNDAIGTNTAQSNVTWTVNSSGLSLDARGYAGTGTGFTGANISGTFTHNSVGLSMSLSVAAPGAAAEANAINLLGANTAGNTTATGSTIGWSGINATLSGTNNSQVVISVPATSSLVGTNGVSISTNGSTITVSAVPNSEFNNFAGLGIAGAGIGNSLVSIQPFRLEWPLAFSNMVVPISIGSVGTAANNSTAYVDITLSGVIYTRNVSTLSSVASFSGGHTATWSSNATATVTAGKFLTATFAGTTLNPQNYWIAIHVSTTNTATGGANTTALGNSLTMILGSNISTAQQAIGLWGNQTNATVGPYSGLGLISTGATRATIGLSLLTMSGTRALNAPVAFGLRNATYQ